MTWPDHPACRTAAACDRCQTSGRFVGSVVAKFGHFDCPLGLTIAAPTNLGIRQLSPTAKTAPKPCSNCRGLSND